MQAILRASMLLLALVVSNPVTAAIEAFADPRNLDEMESLRLTLRIDGISDIGKPDTTPLSQNFEILTSNTTSQYRSVNGKVESWVELQLMLRPKRSGKLTIPALTIGSDTSQPIQIQVNPLDANIKQAIDDMVFFETEVQPNPVYVQSETVLTRRLFYSTSGGVQMYSEMPGAPEIADAVVLSLGQTRSYSTQRDGINYGVVEQRFAIIPERSGKLDIPTVAITSSIRLMKNGRVRRSGVRVTSEPVSLDVLPIPAEYPADQPWLAATNLRIVELWAPNPPVFNVGEPITRHIEARVTGNVASAIPPLTSSSENDANSAFRQYPEPPKLNDATTAGSVEGSRSERVSLLPTAPGYAEIPGVNVTWWDVGEQKVQVTNLPAQRVKVTGTAPTPDPNAKPAEDSDADAATAVAAPTLELAPAPDAPWAQILTWGASACGLFLLLGWLWQRRNKAQLKVNSADASSTNLLRLPLSRRQSLKALEDALAGSPASMRQGLIQFAQNCLQENVLSKPLLSNKGLTPNQLRASGRRAISQSVSSQQAITALQEHKATQPILAQLNAALYGHSTASSPPSTPSADAVLSAARAFSKPATQAKSAALPGLYSTR